MSSLKLHDMRIGTVDNSRIHHRFARIRFLFENVHCQLQYFISIGRINESRVQYTIEHEFRPFPLPGRASMPTKIISFSRPAFWRPDKLPELFGHYAHTQHQSSSDVEAYCPFLLLPAHAPKPHLLYQSALSREND